MFVRGFEKTAKIKKPQKKCVCADDRPGIDQNIRAQRPAELVDRPLEGGHDVYSWV